MIKPEISFENFLSLSIHTGTIVKAELFPKAKNPSYKIWVDFGDLGMKQTSAQVTIRYQIEELIGMQILGLLNIPPRNIAGFISEFLLLGLEDENGSIVLVQPQYSVPNGALLK